VAAKAFATAIMRLLRVASSNRSLRNSDAYHFHVQPPHAALNRDALNE